MDGAVSQAVCNLGEIKLVVAYHLFGCVNFHHGKEFYDPAAFCVPEQLLQLGAPHQVVPADSVYGHAFAQMFLHIAYDSVVGVIPAAGLGQKAGRTHWQGVGKISPVKMDNQLFQVMADELG